MLDVYPDRDSNSANNHLAIPIFTLDRSDIQLSVAQTSVTAVNGTSLQFPRITVNNGAATSRDITVDIPLPSFTTVSSVSADAICSGTTTLQCTFLAVPPNNERTIDISLNTTATGSFTSNLMLTAVNDSTAGNNAASVVVTVDAPGGAAVAVAAAEAAAEAVAEEVAVAVAVAVGGGAASTGSRSRCSAAWSGAAPDEKMGTSLFSREMYWLALWKLLN